MSGAQAALDDVYHAAMDLLEDLAKAHRGWAERQSVTTGLKELAAMHVAFSVMLKTFAIKEVISDPDSLQLLEDLIQGISPAKTRVEQTPKATA